MIGQAKQNPFAGSPLTGLRSPIKDNAVSLAYRASQTPAGQAAKPFGGQTPFAAWANQQPAPTNPNAAAANAAKLSNQWNAWTPEQQAFQSEQVDRRTPNAERAWTGPGGMGVYGQDFDGTPLMVNKAGQVSRYTTPTKSPSENASDWRRRRSQEYGRQVGQYVLGGHEVPDWLAQEGQREGLLYSDERAWRKDGWVGENGSIRLAEPGEQGDPSLFQEGSRFGNHPLERFMYEDIPAPERTRGSPTRRRVEPFASQPAPQASGLRAAQPAAQPAPQPAPQQTAAPYSAYSASRAQPQQDAYATSSPYNPGGQTTQFGNATLTQQYTAGASPYGQQQAPTSPTDGNWANFPTADRPAPFTAQYGNYQGGFSDTPQTNLRDAFISAVNEQAPVNAPPQFDIPAAWQQAEQSVQQGFTNPFTLSSTPPQDSADAVRNLIQAPPPRPLPIPAARSQESGSFQQPEWITRLLESSAERTREAQQRLAKSKAEIDRRTGEVQRVVQRGRNDRRRREEQERLGTPAPAMTSQQFWSTFNPMRPMSPAQQVYYDRFVKENPGQRFFG